MSGQLAENEHVVADADDLADGERVVAEVDGVEVGVFRVGGDLYAYPNACLHQSGPLCEGTVTGTTEADFDRDTLELDVDWANEGEILSCPWHGWEYHLRTGHCLSRTDLRLPAYDVYERDGQVVVSL